MASDVAVQAGITPPSLTKSVVLLGSLVVGIATLLLVVFTTSPSVGVLAILLAIPALVAGTWYVWPRHAWMQAMPHLIVALLLGLGAQGVLCSDGCGLYSVYSYWRQTPTAVAGSFFHALVAILILFTARKAWMPRWLLDIASAGLVGASMFYAGILAQTGSYCSVCMAAHVLMAVQGIHLLRAHENYAPPAVTRALIVVTVFAFQGFLSNMYHFGLPRERSQTGELIAFLRSIGGVETGDQPPGQPSWGSTDAKSTLTVLIEGRCAACRLQIEALTTLSPDVDAKRVRVRLPAATTGPRSDAYRTACLLAPTRAIEIAKIYVDPAITDADATARMAVAAGLADEQLQAAIKPHHDTLTRLIAESDDLIRIYGVTHTPTAIVARNGAAPSTLPGYQSPQRLHAALEDTP